MSTKDGFPRWVVDSCSEMGTFEWDILNPDRIINLEIKKKSGLSLNPDIHHSKVVSSGFSLFSQIF